MNTLSQDLLAKLLATENITVIRNNVSTAAFDIKNRTLVLPKWKNLTNEIEEMLILHEVGHALFTTVEGYGIVQTEKTHIRDYANIIEDVRIEKKMKERYPGSRKSFNLGYKQLNDKDFFGVKQRNLAELLLIDRINLYYKAGYDCGVEFTDQEYVFVERADRCVTEADVIQLAQDIYDFSKQEKLEEMSEDEFSSSSGSKEEGDEDSDDYDYDGASDGMDEFAEGEHDTEDGNHSEPYQEYPEVDMKPETNKKFEQTLSKHHDLDTRTFYVYPKFQYEDRQPLIEYTRILKELGAQHLNDGDFLKQQAYTFKIESNNIVNYLVKEFEMRKSASAYKRAKISKLGQIDMRKLYAYKLKEDIFKQITAVQEGKNHGMVFLLDWSGSMGLYMRETVQQVINLAMFCQKIRIPYQVLAFTDGYPHKDDVGHSIYDPPSNPDGLGMMSHVTLLELFSHKMNNNQFNRMIEFLLDCPWQKNHKYKLNGTPLNHALLYMADYLGEFIEKNNVEKMNLIVLTDGESCSIDKITGGIKSGRCGVMDENGNRVLADCVTYLRDPKTKKDYEFYDYAPQQTTTLLRLLKDRYALRVTGFYITTSNYRVINRFVKYNISDLKPGQSYGMTVDLQAKLRKNKCVILKNVPSRDEMYLILSTNKIEDETIDKVNADMTASQISKQLGKMFNTRKSSRVVLNSFIGVVA